MATHATRRIRGRSAEERRAQRRADLSAAALELFARNGYADTSIEQICQNAYVGTRAFYELFDSKEDCYLALHRQMVGRIEHTVAQAMRQSADCDDEEKMRRRLTAFAHALVDDPRVAVVTFGECAGISPRVEARRRADRRRMASSIEAFWRRRSPGTDIDYYALAVTTVGGLFEAVVDWLHESGPPRPRRIDDLVATLTTFVSVLEAGISVRSSAKPRHRSQQLGTAP